MAQDRITLRSPAAIPRRPPAATTIQRSPVAVAPSPAQVLQQRLGNHGAQLFAAQVVARSCPPGGPLGGGTSAGPFSLSHPGDAHEREADHVADVVMRTAVRASTSTSPSIPTVRRVCADCKEEISTRERADQPVVPGDTTHVHRSASAGGASQVSAPVATNIHDMQGGGAPLFASTRGLFEPRFGADFSHVRVHTGARADSTAKAISAKAFTVGSDIVFAGGQYSPESHEGQHLLAHELTHVVQQSPRELRRDVQRPDGHTTAQAVHSTEQIQRRSAGVIVQRDLLDDVGGAFSDKASKAAKALSGLASDVVDTASGVIDSVKERLQQALDAGLGQINNTWALVKSGATTAVDGAIQQASGFLSGIGALFGAVGTALRSLDVGSLRTVWGAITGAAVAALAGVRGLVARVTATVDGLWSGLQGLANRVIGGLRALANGMIGRLPGAVQGLARSLWSRIEAKLTSAWRAIESGWLSVRASTLKRVNQLVATVARVVTSIKSSVITVIIDTLDRLKHLFAFFKRVMANPNILIDPVVKDITGRLQGLPEKSRAYVQAKVRENAAGGPGTVAAAPVSGRIAQVTGPTSAPSALSISRVIQRSAAPVGQPRSTLSVGDVISGCWDFITDKLGGLWATLGTTIKEMVLSLIYPPATWEALKKDWTQMTEDLATRVSRFDSVRTDTWDGFSEDIRRYLSNLADFPLIVWRAANGMLGHLSVYIGLALVLGGAIAGGIAVATGGAIFGSVVPAAGTAAGAGLGLGAGILAGASAGYALSETVGLILLGSFVIAEEISIFKSLGDLLAVPQSEGEQKEDFSQVADSTIAIVTALLLMAIAFIGVALAKRVWAFVKSIPGRLRPRPKVVDPAPAGPEAPKQLPEGPAKPGSVSETRAKFSPAERRIADVLASEGKTVEATPRSKAEGVRTGDALVDGRPAEFKTMAPGADSATVRNEVNNSIRGTGQVKGAGQARDMILDARGSGLSEAEAIRGLNRVAGITRGKIDSVQIIGDGYNVKRNYP